MWNLRWVSAYQDTDRKKERDASFRTEEAVVGNDLRTILDGDVANLASDPRAGWALRWYLNWRKSKIINRFDTLQSGTRFHWVFIRCIIFHMLVVLYLAIGSLYVPARNGEWGAVVRLLPTHIRALVIYVALFLFFAVTNELLERTGEDQFWALLLPTTVYWIVREYDGSLVWTIVGATCVFVFIVSLRRNLFNIFLKLCFRWTRYDPQFLQEVAQVQQRLRFPSNKVLNLIDRHQFVDTYWKMIWEPSKLSVNLSNRNSFMRQDIGDLSDGLDCLIPRPASPRVTLWGLGAVLWKGMITWLFKGEYARWPKLILGLLAIVVLAFAIGPFFNFEFVMASAVPWGLRCTLRIGVPVFSSKQSLADVTKIFAIVVAMGLTDFPFSIALVSTSFTVFDYVVWRWVLMGLVTFLVLTISDAIAPLTLHFCQKIRMVAAPELRLRPENAEDAAAADNIAI